MTTSLESPAGREADPSAHAIREDVKRMMRHNGDLVPVDLVNGATPPRGAQILYRTRCTCGWSSGWMCADDARYVGHMHVRGIVMRDVAAQTAREAC